jgi:hypothetical protein
MDGGPFTVEDFDVLSDLVLASWGSAVDRDWSIPAGTLEWSCLRTADHTVDCVFSYAFFLASRKEDGYPAFGELHALPGAQPTDLLDGLRAAVNMLHAVIVAAPAGARAAIWRRPAVEVGGSTDFAARGALELVLHGADVCAGLGVPFTPPGAECARLLESTAVNPGASPFEASDNAWSDLLARSGRPRP